MSSKIVIIGSGFSSLSAACYLARNGNEVTILEKNSAVGGRASVWKKDGFTFDMGPTWYWMPDVFEKFFQAFGKKTSDYYRLERLDPGYEVYFGANDKVSIPTDPEEIKKTFESIEKGAGNKLSGFLDEAEKHYDIAINKMVYRPGFSPLELVTPETVTRLGQFVSTIEGKVRRKFNDPKLRSILEFPVLFLGAKPSNTPGFYSFMNHADFGLGTWYPEGGMYSVVKGIEKLALSLGVRIKTEAPVNKIVTEGNKVTGVEAGGEFYPADIVVSGADYNHTEKLLAEKFRNYSEGYWKKKTFAPSALLFYVAFDSKIGDVAHHTLFFDTDFKAHAEDIYDNDQWPEQPLFYASFPTVTDNTIAPEGKDLGIFLIPIAPGLEDSNGIHERYFNIIMNRFEHLTGISVRDKVLFKRSYGVNDFRKDYNAYKGNAYGLANTLRQTSFLRPQLKNKSLPNLFYTGQLTVPGPGVPPSLISGQLVSEVVAKYQTKSQHTTNEITV